MILDRVQGSGNTRALHILNQAHLQGNLLVLLVYNFKFNTLVTDFVNFSKFYMYKAVANCWPSTCDLGTVDNDYNDDLRMLALILYYVKVHVPFTECMRYLTMG